MKKIKVIFFTLIAFFLSTSWVSAECDAKEKSNLNKLAINVKTNYEIIEKEVEVDEDFNPPDGYSFEDGYVYKEEIFKIYITNITEELYVTVTDNFDKTVRTYKYSDATDGTISFEQKVGYGITKYTITIYSSDSTGCANTELNKLSLTTPAYNIFSDYQICEDASDYYLCHKYLSVPIPDMTPDEAEQKISAYVNHKKEEEKKKKEEKESFFEFIKENKEKIIIVSIVIIAIGGIVTVIIVKKQRSRIV